MEDYKLEAQKLIKEGRLSKEDAILAIKILEHNQKIGKNYTFQQILTIKKFLKPIKSNSDLVEQKKKPDEYDISSWELEEISPINKTNVENQNLTGKANQSTSPQPKTGAPLRKDVVTKPIVPGHAIRANNNGESLALELEENKETKKIETVTTIGDPNESLDLMEEEPSKFKLYISKLNWKIAVGILGFLIIGIVFWFYLKQNSKVQIQVGIHQDNKTSIELAPPDQNKIAVSTQFNKEEIFKNMAIVYAGEAPNLRIALGYLITYMGDKFIILNSTNGKRISEKDKWFQIGDKLKFKLLNGDSNIYEAAVIYRSFDLILKPINQNIKSNGFILNPAGSYQKNKNLKLVGIDPPNGELQEKDVAIEKLELVSANLSSATDNNYDPEFETPIALEKKMFVKLDSLICINPYFELIGIQNNNSDFTDRIERRIEASKRFANYFHLALPESSMQFKFKGRTKEGESFGELRFKSPFYFPKSSKFRLNILGSVWGKKVNDFKEIKLEDNFFITELTLLKNYANAQRNDDITLKYELKLCLEVDQGDGFKKVIDDIIFKYTDNNETNEHFDLEFRPIDSSIGESFFEPTENGEHILFWSERGSNVYVYSVIQDKIITSIKIESPASVLSRGDLLFVTSNKPKDMSVYKISEKENWKIINKYNLNSKQLMGMSAPKGEFFKDTFFVYSTDSISSYFLFNHINGEAILQKACGFEYPCYSFNGENLIFLPMTDVGINSVPYLSFTDFKKLLDAKKEICPELKFRGFFQSLHQYSNSLYWVAENGIFWGFPPHRVSKKYNGIVIGEYNYPRYYHLNNGVVDIYSTEGTLKYLGSKTYHFFGASDIFTKPISMGYNYYGHMLTKIVTVLDRTYIFTHYKEKIFKASFDSKSIKNNSNSPVSEKPKDKNSPKAMECKFDLLPVGEPSQCMAFAKENKELLIGSQCTNKLLVWSISENKITHTVSVKNPKIISIKRNIAYVLSDDEDSTISVLDGANRWSIIKTYQPKINEPYYFNVGKNAKGDDCIFFKAKSGVFEYDLAKNKTSSVQGSIMELHKDNFLSIERNQTNFLFGSDVIAKMGQSEPLYWVPMNSNLVPDFNSNDFFVIMAGVNENPLPKEKPTSDENSTDQDNSNNDEEKEPIEAPVEIHKINIDFEEKTLCKMKVSGIFNINEIYRKNHFGCYGVAYTQDDVTKLFVFSFDKSAILFAETKFIETKKY